MVYFDSFGVEHVPEETKDFIGNENINANIFRLQANNSVMCGCFCIGFIDFMLPGKKLTDFTSFCFSLWLWKKPWYNFELFQRWINSILLKLTKQTCHDKQNFG